MRRLGRAAERLETAALKSAGLPRAQGQALIAIGNMARPTMAMLARELDLAPSTATRLLDPLAKRDLIRRESDSDDRRVVVVTLTTQGRRTVRELEAALERAYGRLSAMAGETGGRNRLLAAARELYQALDRGQMRVGQAKRGRPRPAPGKATKAPRGLKGLKPA
jgi:DNA-binding MarR family transcriptional regulator